MKRRLIWLFVVLCFVILLVWFFFRQPLYFDKATKVLVFRTPEPATTPPPTATPTPMSVPPELVRRWTLVHVVVNGEVGPPFDSNQWIRFTSTRTFEAWDGCNEVWGKVMVTDSDDLHVRVDGMTMAKCIVRDTGETIRTGDPFRTALGTIVAYKIRFGELWLYTSADKSNALVFR